MKEEEKKEKEKTASPDVITIRKDSLWKYSTFILVAILIVGAFVLFMEKNNSVAPTGQVINEPEQGASPSPVIDKVNVDTEGYPSKGKADAPVVIVEYSDYQWVKIKDIDSFEPQIETIPAIVKEMQYLKKALNKFVVI